MLNYTVRTLSKGEPILPLRASHMHRKFLKNTSRKSHHWRLENLTNIHPLYSSSSVNQFTSSQPSSFPPGELVCCEEKSRTFHSPQNGRVFLFQKLCSQNHHHLRFSGANEYQKNFERDFMKPIQSCHHLSWESWICALTNNVCDYVRRIRSGSKVQAIGSMYDNQCAALNGKIS